VATDQSSITFADRKRISFCLNFQQQINLHFPNHKSHLFLYCLSPSQQVLPVVKQTFMQLDKGFTFLNFKSPFRKIPISAILEKNKNIQIQFWLLYQYRVVTLRV
jgi:hypothetical protein